MSNIEIGIRISTRRKQLGLTMDDVAQRIGVAKSTVQRYETGQIQKIKLPVIESIASALSVNPDWIIGNTDDPAPKNTHNPPFLPLPRMKQWKILGATACGEAIHLEYDDEFVAAPEDIDADYVFRCKGDSMIGAHIFDGDLVFIKEGEEVLDGQIGVVRVGDEYMLKRLYRFPDYLELHSENPAFPKKIIRGEQENAQIVGKAVKILTRAV